MEKFGFVIGSFVLAGLMGFAREAAADSIEGTISSASEVDYYHFTTSGGTATFDIWGRGYGSSYNYFDSFIWLFEDDGSPDGALTGNDVAHDDDYPFSAGFTDGTTSDLDSYLSTTLSSGDYVLAVASYYLTEDAARAGVNLNGVTVGNYRLTFTGVTVPSASPVPEPATLALFGLGLGALALGRRRRRRAA